MSMAWDLMRKLKTNKTRKKSWNYQIRKLRQQTSRDFQLWRIRYRHHVRPRRKMENAPNIHRVVSREAHLISLIAGSYHPILRIVCTVFSTLDSVQKHCVRRQMQKKLMNRAKKKQLLCKWVDSWFLKLNLNGCLCVCECFFPTY